MAPNDKKGMQSVCPYEFLAAISAPNHYPLLPSNSKASFIWSNPWIPSLFELSSAERYVEWNDMMEAIRTSSSSYCEFIKSDCWCVWFTGAASKGKGNKKANEAAKATLKGVSAFFTSTICNMLSYFRFIPIKSEKSDNQRPFTSPRPYSCLDNRNTLASRSPASPVLMNSRSSFIPSTPRAPWRRLRKTTP